MSRHKNLRLLVVSALLLGTTYYAQAAELTEALTVKGTILAEDTVVTVTEANAKDRKMVSALYSPYGSYEVDKQHPMVIDVNGQVLTLKANSSNNISSAIYVGVNQYINVDNITGEALKINATNTDTRGANGIYADSNAHLTVNGPVIITGIQTKGDAATGIAIQGQRSDITINGNLTVDSVEGLRGRGFGINANGIRITGDDSKIFINGLVDLKNIKGVGINTTGANSYISAQGGTIVTADDSDFTKKYYAIRVDKGVVEINMNEGQPGTNKVDITGDLFVTKEEGKSVIEYSGGMLRDVNNKGVLNLALTTKDSKLDGLIGYELDKKDWGAGGYNETKVGTTTLYLQNGATWINEQHTSIGKQFTGSFVANLVGGDSDANTGVILQKDNRNIRIGNIVGNNLVVYEHTGDGLSADNYAAGNVMVERAAENAKLTVSTSNEGIDTTNKEKVTTALNTLANKLTYEAYATGERNLTGQVQIASGLTASSITANAKPITFTDEGLGTYVYVEEPEPEVPTEPEQPANPGTGAEQPTNPSTEPTQPGDSGSTTVPSDSGNTGTGTGTDTSVDTPVQGAYETAIMKGIRSSIVASVLDWREIAGQQNGRMFDLRNGEEAGLWVKLSNGKFEYTGSGLDVDMKNNTYQLGYDGNVGHDWIAGAEITYRKGDTDFSYGGSADRKTISAGIYATKQNQDSSYIDLTAKVGRLTNDFVASNEIGQSVRGDFKAYAYSISGQYGKRINNGANYFEPQVQLTYSYVDDASFNGSNNSDTIRVDQDSFTSLVGRVGLEVGRTIDKGSLYGRVSVYHEFSGDIEGTYTANDGGQKATKYDLGDTWTGLTLGGQYNVAPNSHVYLELSRGLSGDYQSKWEGSIGYKHSF